MKYLVTITNEDGDAADVDVALEDLDLTNHEGQETLAEAVREALAELANEP